MPQGAGHGRRSTSAHVWLLAAAAAAAVCAFLPGSALATLPIGEKVRVSHMGPDGSESFDAFSADVAYNPLADQYLAVWEGDDAVDGEFEIWGRLLDGSGSPLGGQFRISRMGPAGDPAFDASSPAVAYNPQADEYLVVWAGDTSISIPLGTFNLTLRVDDELEIHGQRLSARGDLVGPSGFRISTAGPRAGPDRLVGGAGFDLGNGGRGRDVCKTERRLRC